MINYIAYEEIGPTIINGKVINLDLNLNIILTISNTSLEGLNKFLHECKNNSVSKE
jgi:hypothetical protein